MTLDDVADLFIDWAAAEARVRALWIEAPTLPELRRPYRTLELHLSADEPAYPSVTADIAAGFAAAQALRAAGIHLLGASDAPRFAKEYALEVEGLRFTLIAEQSYLLAKRPRAEVVPLLDKTGHIAHVMDFSRRKRG